MSRRPGTAAATGARQRSGKEERGEWEVGRGRRTFLPRAGRKVPARLRAGPVAQAPESRPDNGGDWQ